MHNKKMKLALVFSFLILFSLTNVLASYESKIVDTAEYGPVTITVYTPNIFNNLFAAFFTKTQVYKGEQVDIIDSFTILNGPCELYSWKIFIIKDGIKTSLGDFSDLANDLGQCNLEVNAAFITTSAGTYSLQSQYQVTSSSSQINSNGQNSLVVLDQSSSQLCEYQGWKYYSGISNGYVKWNEYKDLNLADNVQCTDRQSQYQTFCNDGYYIGGLSDGVSSAAGVHSCTAGLTCSELGGSICVFDEVCSGQLAIASDTNLCCTGVCSLPNSNSGSNSDSTQKQTVTKFEYYSISDKDLFSKNVLCTSSSQCPLKQGYEVECLSNDQIINRYFDYSKSVCDSQLGSLDELVDIFKKALPIFGNVPLCSIVSDAAYLITFQDNNVGICTASSTSSLSKFWEGILDTVSKLGIPSNYVFIAAIALLILLLAILANLLK